MERKLARIDTGSPLQTWGFGSHIARRHNLTGGRARHGAALPVCALRGLASRWKNQEDHDLVDPTRRGNFNQIKVKIQPIYPASYGGSRPAEAEPQRLTASVDQSVFN